MKNNNNKSKRTFSPKKIGESIYKINQNFTSKLGKVDYVIFSKWKEIVGIFFSNHSEPLKIHSTKNYQNDSKEPDFSNSLYVNVSPAAALEFQHFKDKIIEKINSYFGYQAINDIRIIQNYVPNADIVNDNTINSKSLKSFNKEELKKHTKDIKNKDLEDSIVKLGMSINMDEDK